jgi:hypothetical protein
MTKGKSKLLFWWAVFFVTTAMVALTIQLVVLPGPLAWMHAGHGLLAGGDWIGFHRFASETAHAIHEQGWHVWSLRPEGNTPQGIAAAVYALAGVSEPYTLIPLNAALHATAGVTLMAILEELGFERRISLIAVLPLLCFPSAASWYSQIHKEGSYIAGVLLFLYGTIKIFNESWFESRWSALPALTYVVFGVFLVWLVREYGVILIKTFGYLVVVIGWVWIISLLRRKTLALARLPVLISSIIAIPLICSLFLSIGWGGQRSENYWVGSPSVSSTAQGTGINRGEGSDIYTRWEGGFWLPERVDNMIYTAAQMREGYVLGYPDAKSFIDPSHRASNSGDVITYLPRAFQIGLFAPFPNEWFSDKSSEQGGFYRSLVRIETVITYLMLAGLPFAIILLHRSIQFWIIVIFSGVFLTIYGYVTPNLGALYRMRYVFLMALAAIGFAGIAKTYLRRHLSTYLK